MSSSSSQRKRRKQPLDKDDFRRVTPRIARNSFARRNNQTALEQDFGDAAPATPIPRRMDPHLAAVVRNAQDEVDVAIETEYTAHRKEVLNEKQQQSLVAEAVSAVIKITKGRNTIIVAVVETLEQSKHVRLLSTKMQRSERISRARRKSAKKKKKKRNALDEFANKHGRSWHSGFANPTLSTARERKTRMQRTSETRVEARERKLHDRPARLPYMVGGRR